MGISERKARDRVERADRITTTARAIAERDGWAAVTIRRLADEIEFSQPVLYAHYENRDAIVATVALRGFVELAAALRSAPPEHALEHVARGYLAFAREHPATYEAMFVLPTSLHFARRDTEPELRSTFAALSSAIATQFADTDVEAATELFWASLHGLAELERSGRIRTDAREARIALIVRGFSVSRTAGASDAAGAKAC